MAQRARDLLVLAALVFGLGVFLTGTALVWAAAPSSLTVTVAGLAPGGNVPQAAAYCAPDGKGHDDLGPNVSPAISWSTGPAGTASYAIIVYDTDVPSVFTDANKEGKVLPAELPRVDFYHWVFVDIPASVTALPAGADSNGVVPNGKPAGPTKYGVRGVNGFGPGVHGGYDGPCPPWNDERAHHYHFAVYALNVAHLGVSGDFTGPDALRAMRGHVLATGEVVGTYALNPAVRRSLGLP
jgi:Raf kinase inhibitor-like YbhB/YbcL family protein